PAGRPGAGADQRPGRRPRRRADGQPRQQDRRRGPRAAARRRRRARLDGSHGHARPRRGAGRRQGRVPARRPRGGRDGRAAGQGRHRALPERLTPTVFTLLARFVARYPRWVLAAWLVLTLAATPFAARVGEVLTAEPTAPAQGVARAVAELLAREFALPQGEVLAAVARPAGGVDAAGLRAAAERAAAAVAALPGVAYVRDRAEPAGLDLGEDGREALFVIGLEPQPQEAARATVAAVRAAFAAQPAAEFELAGGVATLIEVEEVSQRDARHAELYGLPISLAILVLAFGALVAAGLPLVSAGTPHGASGFPLARGLRPIAAPSALLFALGQVVEFAVFTRTVVTMLGLATGIDYALLIVNRFREELAAGLGAREAAERTTREAGRA